MIAANDWFTHEIVISFKMYFLLLPRSMLNAKYHNVSIRVTVQTTCITANLCFRGLSISRERVATSSLHTSNSALSFNRSMCTNAAVLPK